MRRITISLLCIIMVFIGLASCDRAPRRPEGGNMGNPTEGTEALVGTWSCETNTDYVGSWEGEIEGKEWVYTFTEDGRVSKQGEEGDTPIHGICSINGNDASIVFVSRIEGNVAETSAVSGYLTVYKAVSKETCKLRDGKLFVEINGKAYTFTPCH